MYKCVLSDSTSAQAPPLPQPVVSDVLHVPVARMEELLLLLLCLLKNSAGSAVLGQHHEHLDESNILHDKHTCTPACTC